MSLVLKDSDKGEKLGSKVTDAAGQVDASAKVTWASDNPAVAAVTDNGDGTADATPVGVGTANITATATDPDGNAVPSPAFAVQVIAGDAHNVSVSDLGPLP